MTFQEYFKEHTVILDGGMGTLLQAKGLKPGERPEEWNLTHPEVIADIHRAYYDAGSSVVSTNTFGANTLKFSEAKLERIVSCAIENAKKARELSTSSGEKFIALDIGPTGKLLKPLGDLDFEDAVKIFSHTVRLGVKYGVDLIFIETMNDSYETRAALLAAKESSDLPVFVSNAYGEDGKLMTGADPEAMVALLEGMGADAIGANCSLGPKKLRPVVERLLEKASVPVILKPNAGLPKLVDGKTVFDVSPEDFAEELAELVKKGVRVAGGCCGTTPEYIRALCERVRDLSPRPVTKKNFTVISSYTHAVEFGEKPILIGERINPTGKKRLKEALIRGDMDYLLSEAVLQEEKGVDVLDVNVGLPEIDEGETLKRAVTEIQAVSDLPLQIDTASVSAMEKALRVYNGKAMINSVNGKKESMEAIFPLVKKYGGLVVALTLDENGIPDTAEGRVAIAKKILATASDYGIDKKDIIFDPLALTVSAEKGAPSVTLRSLRLIREELGCHTSLGVSNVSFGLPVRDAVNGVFFTLALENGLSAAIMNPHSVDMMKSYYAYRALKGMDENCKEYVAASEFFAVSSSAPSPVTEKKSLPESQSALQRAIVKGFQERAAEITGELLLSLDGLDIIQGEIIPALNTVGKGFENKTVYLPQLLMSAEAAKSAFEAIRSSMSSEKNSAAQMPVILATVKGDVHDIGKNIVKLLMENYGFDVIDLGKDVPPERILDAVRTYNAPLVGLSALMTTTVPAMEETILLLKEKAPSCKVMVGGAVLTRDYAERIGAHFYAKDAMEGVRFAQSVFESQNK